MQVATQTAAEQHAYQLTVANTVRMPYIVIAAALVPLVAAEVVFIGLFGECLEQFTFDRAQRSLRKIVEILPRRCWRLRRLLWRAPAMSSISFVRN